MTLQGLMDDAARKGIKPCNVRLITSICASNEEGEVTNAVFTATDEIDIDVDWNVNFYHIKE